jgi:Tol biopolymer transport system component
MTAYLKTSPDTASRACGAIPPHAVRPGFGGLLTVLLLCGWAAVCQGETAAAEPSRAAIGAIVADRHTADSALAVHLQALEMPPADRYAFLKRWVLPDESHQTMRVTLDFTPTHPAPPVARHSPADALRIEQSRQRGTTRVQIGGNLISPALDLIAVAKELKKLDELRIGVEQMAPQNEPQQRARLALLALIDIESGQFDAALSHLDALYPLVEANNEHTLASHAADLLAIHGALAHAPTRSFARDAAANLYGRAVRISSRGPAVAWESHLLAMMAQIRNFDRPADESSELARDSVAMSQAPPLTEWSPSSRTTASSRGTGHSLPHWQRVGDRIENANSHQDDFLYYHVPVQGRFEVECDVQTRDYQNTQLVVGGQWVESLYYSLDKFDFGNLREKQARAGIEPKLTKYRDRVHMRGVVRDHEITWYANGRLLHRAFVNGDVDPWIVLRSENRHDGSTTDVRITGEPVVPRELRLSASADLTGWFPYFTGPPDKPNAEWQPAGDVSAGGGIVGVRRPDLAGMHAERLIRYHRPMFEDGTIEYEFLHRPGELDVHPALDRLAFLLERDGVRIHWVTDGAHDRTGLRPDNVFDEADHRRGPTRLPLLDDAWNRLRLTLRKDTVSLFLNDQLIYERDLEITNQRTFGLFHFSDRGEARVRNVRWRGDWPHELPPVERQELADRTAQRLESRLPELKDVFEHNFAEGGFPSETFTLMNSTGGTIGMTPDGVRIDRPGSKGYFVTTLSPQIVVTGDFDVIAEFARFDPRPGADAISTVGIRLLTREMKPQQCLLMRRLVRRSKEEDLQVAQAVVRNGATDATLDWGTVYSDALESAAARLWVARRGDRLSYLVSEGDSPNFRLLGESEVAAGSLPPNGVQLMVQHSGEGRTSAVWKSMVVRAQSLTKSSAADNRVERTLSVMNHDGTGLVRLLPKESEIDSPGSPAWSPDGKQIAFDDYNNSTANSRMYLINGSNLRDLGIGNMPNFSPDGKRLAFSWGGRGVAVMNVDGTNREVLDGSGWGAQWSPDGRHIAYGKSGNILVYDLETRSQRAILVGDQASRYSSVYWNLGWSRDGRRVCFKGRSRTGGRYELAVADVAGPSPEFSVLFADSQEMIADFSWHPDGRRILFCMRGTGGLRLFTVDRTKSERPELLPGQPMFHSITGADWSPDGKRVAFSSQVLPDASSRRDVPAGAETERKVR